MKKIFKYLVLTIFLLIGLGILYEQIFLIKRYNFEFENYKVKVVADECESCFLDWPINNTITIENKNNDKVTKEEFYTEGPQIEFGINKARSTILINCPGFSHFVLESSGLTKIEDSYNIINDSLNFLDYSIYYKINKQNELIKMHGEKPSNEW